MCRKLMFPIILVVLLGLTSSLWAAEVIWDGICVGDSFCCAENWNPPVVPGPGDIARSNCGKDILIDCDVTVAGLELPAYEGDCNQNMTMTSGNVTAGKWEAIAEGNKVGRVIVTGGTITINGGGDSIKWNEDGDNNTRGYYSFGGNAVFTVASGNMRTGDSNARVYIDVYDNAIFTVSSGYARIGDDGGGWWKFRGNCQATFMGNNPSIQTGCRNNSGDFYLQDNAQVYCYDSLELNKYSNAAGHAYISGGTLNAGRILLNTNCHMQMTGGKVIARTVMNVASGADATLEGGTIEAGALMIAPGGVVNITGSKSVAKIILAGNQIAAVAALMCSGGGLRGGGSSRSIAMDYNITTPGKTTVWFDPSLDICEVYCPEPANGAINVPSVVTPVTLRWTRGDCTYPGTRDFVYFGTDPNLVCNATGVFLPPPITLLQPAQKLIGNLPLWTTYYWRVDETVTKNGVSGVLIKGKCWRFTTGCAPIVGDANKDCLVNFLDFANLAGVWQESQYWPPQ